VHKKNFDLPFTMVLDPIFILIFLSVLLTVLPGPASPSLILQPKTTAILAPSTATYHKYTFFHTLFFSLSSKISIQKFLTLQENSTRIVPNLILMVSFQELNFKQPFDGRFSF
jgi:hypothetical protein